MHKAFLLLVTICAGTAAQTSPAVEWNNRGSKAFAAWRYGEAETAFRKAVVAAEQPPQLEAAQRATIYSNLAAVYRSQARYEESEVFYKKALGCASKETNATESALRGLALLYLGKGKLSQAEHTARLAVKLNTERGNNPSRMAQAYNDLAIILLERGQLDEASDLASQSLNMALSETVRGTVLNTLGRVALAKGDGIAAQGYLSETEQILTRTSNGNDPAMAAVRANLGHAQLLCGNRRSAIANLERAIATLERVKGPNHPDVASALTNLGTVYESQKHLKKARLMFERAWDIDSKALGPDSVKAAVDLSNLGSLAFLQHRWSDAETMMNRALAIYRHRLGEDHPNTGELAGNLAILYSTEERYSEAAPLLLQAITNRERNFGVDDRTLGKLLAVQGVLFRRQGQFSEAHQAEVRCLRIAVSQAIKDARSKN